MRTTYRLDHLHAGFDKHVLDISTKGGLARVAVHHFFELEDIGSQPHSHPFTFRSTVLTGWYDEDIYHSLPDGAWWRERVRRNEGDVFTVEATTIHKVIAISPNDCITAVIQWGEPQNWWHYQFVPEREVLMPAASTASAK